MAMTSTDRDGANSCWSIGVVLFDEFELLDVFGPLEMYGMAPGMDMTLALIARLLGEDAAEQVATWTEYEWHRDSEWDPFAEVYGLI